MLGAEPKMQSLELGCHAKFTIILIKGNMLLERRLGLWFMTSPHVAYLLPFLVQSSKVLLEYVLDMIILDNNHANLRSMHCVIS
jgi:hypothetical protein